MISSNFFKDSLTTNQFGEFILDTLYQSVTHLLWEVGDIAQNVI